MVRRYVIPDILYLLTNWLINLLGMGVYNALVLLGCIVIAFSLTTIILRV